MTNEELMNKAVNGFIKRNPILRDHKEDMLQEAQVGLCKALKKYKSDQGAEFSTYAYFWVNRELFRYVKKEYDHLNNIEMSKELLSGELYEGRI